MPHDTKAHEARYFITRTHRDHTEVRAIITDQMEHYDPRDYAPEIQAGQAERVAREEWEYAWEPNNVDVFGTRAEAEAALERSENYRAVIIEITPEHISAALTALFGAD